MAYQDWNGNGEMDKIDDAIGYGFFNRKKADSKAEKKHSKKSTIFLVLAVALCLLCAFILPAVIETDAEVLWKSALYTEGAEIGYGNNHFVLEVVVGSKSVTFEIHSDKSTVGEALLEHNIISGEQGPYGLYIKNVNGITADYDVDRSYWAFTKNGKYMQTGVDGEHIESGAHYELVYTK